VFALLLCSKYVCNFCVFLRVIHAVNLYCVGHVRPFVHILYLNLVGRLWWCWVLGRSTWK